MNHLEETLAELRKLKCPCGTCTETIEQEPVFERLESLITSRYSDLEKRIEGMRLTMRAAIETGSDAGAGYTIGFNAALDDILSIIRDNK